MKLIEQKSIVRNKATGGVGVYEGNYYTSIEIYYWVKTNKGHHKLWRVEDTELFMDAIKNDEGKPQLSLLPKPFVDIAIIEEAEELIGKTIQEIYLFIRTEDYTHIDEAIRYLLESFEGADKDPIIGLTRVMEFGEKKYSRDNWRQGFDKYRLLDASLRHLYAYHKGQQFDEESGLDHRFHTFFGLSVVLEQEEICQELV